MSLTYSRVSSRPLEANSLRECAIQIKSAPKVAAGDQKLVALCQRLSAQYADRDVGALKRFRLPPVAHQRCKVYCSIERVSSLFDWIRKALKICLGSMIHKDDASGDGHFLRRLLLLV